MLDENPTHPANDSKFGLPSRSRTVPIPESITPVPGYPRKLVVFKIAASKYWQVRCWIGGRTHKRSTQSMSLKVAQSFARVLYEQLLAQTQPASAAYNPPKIFSRAKQRGPESTFGQLAEDMYEAEKAWAVGFMVNSFIRPSDLKTLKHKHVEVVKSKNTYLRLTLPITKNHHAPIVTLFPAVKIYREICKYQITQGKANPNDYLFLPSLKDRNYALNVLNLMFNWVLDIHGYKYNAHGQPRSLYSLRHSAITFRLLYGNGIDLLTLARNARTSVEVINNHYASTLLGEQNIAHHTAHAVKVLQDQASMDLTVSMNQCFHGLASDTNSGDVVLHVSIYPNIGHKIP